MKEEIELEKKIMKNIDDLGKKINTIGNIDERNEVLKIYSEIKHLLAK